MIAHAHGCRSSVDGRGQIEEDSESRGDASLHVACTSIQRPWPFHVLKATTDSANTFDIASAPFEDATLGGQILYARHIERCTRG